MDSETADSVLVNPAMDTFTKDAGCLGCDIVGGSAVRLMVHVRRRGSEVMERITRKCFMEIHPTLQCGRLLDPLLSRAKSALGKRR